MEQGEQAARGILIGLLGDKLKTCQKPEREQITQELLVATDTEQLADLYNRYLVEPAKHKETPLSTSLKLLIDGDMTTSTSPDRITAILEANADAGDIQLIDCSAQQLLNFLLEVQQYAIDQHVHNSIEEEQES